MATETETRRRRRSSHESSHSTFRPGMEARSYSRASTRGPHDITFEEQLEGKVSDNSLWHDAPLFVALLPCIGAFIFGTEYVQDIILFVCVCWYLHTCIRLPWTLYELSRPRPVPSYLRQNMTSHQLEAENTLRWRSLIYLAIAFAAPFLGLLLMQRILSSVGAVDDRGPYITYFHGTLFILFGGVRPINHIAALMAGSTRELQGRVHHPPPKNKEEENMEEKLERMEMLLSMLTEKFREQEESKANETSTKQQGMLEVQDNFEKTAARLEDGARRREKKVEIALEMMDRKLEALEKQSEAIISITLKEREQTQRNEPPFRRLVLKWLDWIESWWLLFAGQRSSKTRSPYSPTNRADLRRLGVNGNSRSGSTTLGPRKRSYDGAGPNLDTVVEEGPETDTDPADVSPTASALVDKEGHGGPELTMPSRGVRRRTRVPGALESQTSTSTATPLNGSQFVRIPVEGSKPSKRRGHASESAFVEG